MIFLTNRPAPLAVRVARVAAVPVVFAAYFLMRAPQVADGVMVPWPEAVTATLTAAVLVPMWLYWVADLVAWTRDRPTPPDEPSPLELTADLSDHGVFAGDLAALVDAQAKGRPVPPRPAMAAGYSIIDDQPTELLLLTHEFTPASGIRMDAVKGRHRREERPLPLIEDCPNPDAYAQLNRSRELPF